MYNTEPRYFISIFNNDGKTAVGRGFYVLTEQVEDIYEYRWWTSKEFLFCICYLNLYYLNVSLLFCPFQDPPSRMCVGSETKAHYLGGLPHRRQGPRHQGGEEQALLQGGGRHRDEGAWGRDGVLQRYRCGGKYKLTVERIIAKVCCEGRKD